MAAALLLLWMVVAFYSVLHGECAPVPALTRIPKGETVYDTATTNSTRSLQKEWEQYAVLRSEGVVYRGTMAVLNVCMPKLENPAVESSRGMIRLETGLEVIEVGWQVNPSQYLGDITPFLYIYTEYMENQDDGSIKSRSCWYDSCGFVETGPHPMRKALLIDELLHFHLFMKENGDWKLKINDRDVGYWPHESIRQLSSGAELIYWGGKLTSTADSPSRVSQMGNGRAPVGANVPRAAVVYGLKVRDQHGALLMPTGIHRYETNHHCYIVSYSSGQDGLHYGGPIRNCS